jgi:hypothetical protein
MNASEQSQFLQMISGLLDGTLAAAETEQLVERLAADVEAPALYLKYVAFNIHLEWSCSTRSPRDILTIGPATDTVQPTARFANQPQLTELTSTRSLPPEVSNRNPLFLRASLRYAALVALCLYGSFVLVAWNLRPDRLNRNDAAIAVVRNTTDVQWSSAVASKSAESPVLSGEPLKIDSGTIELELKAGTKLVIEGPADWSIDGDNKATLRRGTLVAAIPHQAIGFTLDTPSARVVDLGTEFFATANANGTSTVHVVLGEVAVTSLTKEGKPQPNSAAVRLRKGFGMEFHPEDFSATKVIASPPKVVQKAQSLQRSMGGLKSRLESQMLTNAGFEFPLADTNGGHDDAEHLRESPFCWKSFGVVGLFDPNATFVAPPQTQGEQIGFLVNDATLFQTITHRVQPHTRYTFSVDVAGCKDHSEFAKVNIGIFIGDDPPTGITVARTAEASPPNGGWKNFTISYASGGNPPAGNVGVFIQNRAMDGQVFLDNAMLKMTAEP